MIRKWQSSERRRRQRGYTMVELMVSLTIALFLLAGLTTVVMHTRNASTTQSQMAQLQDSERIAMTVLTDVIQQAGYFPDPTHNSTTIFQPGVAISTNAGGSVNFASTQVISGVAGGAPPGDAIAVRFASPQAYSTDTGNYLPNSIANCAGTTVKDTTGTHVFTNVFQVNSATHYLQCLLYEDNALINTYNLVPGVYDMQVQYGLGQASDNNVVSYIPASGFSNNIDPEWRHISSVRITLFFWLPQYGLGGGQLNTTATASAASSLNPTMYVQRVIPIMIQTGG